MTNLIFTAFSFGPIQAGLFVAEAFKSGNFAKIVIAEIDQNLSMQFVQIMGPIMSILPVLMVLELLK